MTKEHEKELLWDTVTILKEQNRLENVLVLFKSLIEHTFLSLRLPINFLEEVKLDLPSTEFVTLIHSLDKDIYQSIQRGDMLQAYERLVEYIEKLSEVIPDEHRKTILAKILANQTDSHVEPIMPKYGSTQLSMIKPANVYTSTEVAEIIGVADQTIRRWCEKGKYPDAYQTKGGHWRIPIKYFKISLDEARKRDVFEQELNGINAGHGL